MKLDRNAKRDLLIFGGAAFFMFILSPELAVFAIITGFIVVCVSALMSRLSKWPYTRTLFAVGGGFMLGSMPYFLLAAVLILIDPP